MHCPGRGTEACIAIPAGAMKRVRLNNLSANRGFTLVEVLATLLIMGIVLPVAMKGVSVMLGTASTARHMQEAAALGETKLNDLIISGDALAPTASGDF